YPNMPILDPRQPATGTEYTQHVRSDQLVMFADLGTVNAGMVTGTADGFENDLSGTSTQYARIWSGHLQPTEIGGDFNPLHALGRLDPAGQRHPNRMANQ